ncbi:Crp/Fnr family transcriptional regulator [Jiulongibacter sediminis]|uniref:Crp/Fnr family transcriptional regulator n=1 Tax=Jiulongibacter sediminis TaxID=1605367 RepID=UPI0026EBF1FD|nr:Crp/Fnr family transcriptional regulator [Jiulongibacter sediminis]
MKNLIKTLENQYHLDRKHATKLASRFDRVILPKGAFLIRSSETNRDLFFIEKGLCREYSVFEEGEHLYETTIQFYSENDFVFVKNPNLETPSESFFQTLEATVIFTLPKQSLRDFLGDNFFFERLLTEKVSRLSDRMQIFVNTRKSKNKYDKFKYAYSDILHRIPDKMIASYLMINPGTLSRLRGNFD